MRALSLPNLNLVPLRDAVHEPPVTERLSRDEVMERAVKETMYVSLMAKSKAQRNDILQLRIRSRLAGKGNK